MSKKRKKHHDEHEEHMDESWLIPYADLLTLLLALFIVLFAQSTMDAKKFEAMGRAFNEAFHGGTGVLDHSAPVETPAPPQDAKHNPSGNEQTPAKQADQVDQAKQAEQENFEELKKKIDKYLQENALQDQIKTDLQPDGLRIVIPDVTFFRSGSADIQEDKFATIRQMATVLSLFPRQVVVSGHTDNKPIHNASFDSNWDLSAKRAVNFLQILLDSGKLDASLFSAVGYGEFRPTKPNDTEANRAANRRVEIFIYKAK